MAVVKRLLSVLLVLGLVAFGIAAATVRFDYAPMPGEADILNADRLPAAAPWDVLGRPVTAEEADRMLATPDGARLLSAAAGAVRVDDTLAASGREAFYRETFGNEVFLTEVLGILDGALSPGRVASALLALRGRGTDDLAVTLDRDVVIGARTLKAGDVVSTGLAVPKGEYLPLGTRLFYDRGRVRVGLTCALCHAAVDRGSGRVVEGAPNTRLRIGLILALAANPSAMLAHAGIGPLAPYLTKPENMVRTAAGPSAVLPDPDTLEPVLRANFASWPPGSFDATLDGVTNPTSIPSLFVAESYPYGWSGQAALGPFRGLASIGSDLHGLAVDPTARTAAAQALFGIDPEIYLGTILQQAPTPEFRFESWDGRRPSEILTDADPQHETPGLTRLVALPTFPLASFVTLNGLVPVRGGEPVGRVLNALAAFMSRLRPPDLPGGGSSSAIGRGRDVFKRAGCRACHSGPALSSNRVWPASVIGTEPSRARAFAATEAATARPQLYAPDTAVPVAGGARLLDVPVPDRGQLTLAWGYNRTGGGYKVPGLLGLAWTAPYLHDGSIGVAADGRPIPTEGEAPLPDPQASLRGLLDRTARAPITAAHAASAASRAARVTGTGHAYWVDREAGFSDQDRDALVTFLLSIDRLQPPPPPGVAR